MIKLTKEEVLAINIINAKSQELQGLLVQSQEAAKAVIVLLELKYNATYDQTKGQFNSKEPEGEQEI